MQYSTNPPAGKEINTKAKQINSRGLRAFQAGNLAAAEQLFRDALKEDSSFGPAHNNLGQVYLSRHQLYLAAWEFEYAANLMPELVEPIINQGLAYETGEQIDRAAEFYQQAYQRNPSHPVAIASLVRARIKQDGDPIEIGALLDELIMNDGRQPWVEWAKELRATKYQRSHADLVSADCEVESFGDESRPLESGSLGEGPELNQPLPAYMEDGQSLKSPAFELPTGLMGDVERPSQMGFPPVQASELVESVDTNPVQPVSFDSDNDSTRNPASDTLDFEANELATQIMNARASR